MWPDNMGIEIVNVQQRAFIRHVKLAVLWRDHRQQGRYHQMEAHHRFIDFPPERIAIASVGSGVDIDRHHQMR
ncbi:hypothetical protein D3C76_1774590 [compost metagenome]